MAEKKVAKKEEVEIVLLCANKYLGIDYLGVQFVDGVFKTYDRELADKVLKYDSVFEK